MAVSINPGTITPIATDLVGTVNYQVVKLDMGSAGTTNLFAGVSNPLPVVLSSAIAGEDITTPNNVLGVLMRPSIGTTYAPTEYDSLGGVTGTLVKGSAGNIFSAFVTSGTTAIRYFQLFNQSTAPVLGQTAVNSYPIGSAAAGAITTLQLDTTHFAPSRYLGTGIAWAISSTQGTLGTANVTAADYSVKIKYI